jgi:acetyl esterase/lipase
MLGTAEVTGLVRGSGRRVVVLSRQSRGTPCDLAALGHALSGAGFRVVSWTAGLDTNQDTLALLVRAERKAGARYVALVGASAGGATSIGAAALIRPALDAVVALSPSSQSELFGDVVPSAARYSGPLMVVVGEGDTAFAGIVPQLESAHQGEESMIVLPGVSQHGKSLVATIDAPVTQAVLDFLAR